MIYFLWIMVDGKRCVVCQYGDNEDEGLARCKHRAERKFGEYEILQLQTQDEFMREIIG